MSAFLALASPATTFTPVPVSAGGQTSGNLVLDAVVFIVGVGILGGILFWITKKVLIDEKY